MVAIVFDRSGIRSGSDRKILVKNWNVRTVIIRPVRLSGWKCSSLLPAVVLPVKNKIIFRLNLEVNPWKICWIGLDHISGASPKIRWRSRLHLIEHSNLSSSNSLVPSICQIFLSNQSAVLHLHNNIFKNVPDHRRSCLFDWWAIRNLLETNLCCSLHFNRIFDGIFPCSDFIC